MPRVEYKTHSSSATIKKHKEDIEVETQKTLVRYSDSAEFKEMLMAADVLQVMPFLLLPIISENMRF